MPTTEDYLIAIRQRRADKKSLSVDFSSFPEGVDVDKIKAEMSYGLPPEYSTAIKSKTGKTKLDYSMVPFTEPVKVAFTPTPTVPSMQPKQAYGITPETQERLSSYGETGRKIAKGAFATAGFTAALTNAVIGSVILGDKKAIKDQWDRVKEMGDKAPLEEISNALGLATIIYGGVEGLKSIPTLYNMAKSNNLIRNLTNRERGLTVSNIPKLKMTDKELTEFFSKSDKGIQKAMAVHNPQMRRILQTGIKAQVPIPKPVKPPLEAPTAIPGVVPPITAPKIAPQAIIKPVPAPIEAKPPAIVPKPAIPVVPIPGKEVAPKVEAPVEAVAKVPKTLTSNALPNIPAKPIKTVVNKGKQTRISVMPKKDDILLEVGEALKTAPEVRISGAPDMGAETITFKIDGGLKVKNDKVSLQDAYDKLKGTPAEIVTPAKIAPKSISTGFTSGDEFGELIKSKKSGFISDGRQIIKLTAPKKAKYKAGDFVVEEKNIDTLLNAKGQPAEFKYYAIDTPRYSGVSDMPIHQNKKFEAVAVMQSGDKFFHIYQNQLINILNHYPNATFKLSDSPFMIIAYDGKEPISVVSAIKKLTGEGKKQISIPWTEPLLHGEAVKSGLVVPEKPVIQTPITPIAKPSEITELGAGITPPKAVRDALNSALISAIPAEDKINAMGNVIKFYLGTKRERFQIMAGSTEKGNAWYNAVRRMNANFTSIKAMVERRNREIFSGLPVSIRKHAHDIAKGISKNASGEIVGGGIQPAGTMKIDSRLKENRGVGPGSVLKDNRVVGNALEEGGNEYQLYRRFDTLNDYKELVGKYPQAKVLFDKLLALNETVDKTKLGAELPAFSREVIAKQYDIKTVHPQDYRYVPSIKMEDKFFTKIGNLFKSYTASARKYKTGILAETDREDKDLLRTLTSKQNEIAFESLFNNTIGDILATILEPIGKGGVKPGFKEVNINEPRLAKIIELKKDLLLANGIDVSKISTYQYPMNVDKEFSLSRVSKFEPEMQSIVDTLAKRTNEMVGFVLSNYLIRPSTAIRNLTSGFVQYNLKTLTHLYSGLRGKGFRPMVNDIKALGTSLKPSTIKELPAEILGLNFYSDIPESVKIMDIALIPFRAVETYFKRASFDSDLATIASNKFDESLAIGQVKPIDKQKFINDYRINYFSDLFDYMASQSDSVTFDYGNKPYVLEKMSNTIGRGLVPYPNYMYHKWRMYAEYSPLALKGATKENYGNRVDKALAGTTMFAISAAIAMKVVEQRKEKIKELELKKLPWEFDTTGRIKINTDENVERWLRVYDLPYLGDTIYMMEIMQKQAGIDDWTRDSLAMGPIFNTIAMFMGLKTKYSTGLATASIAGQQAASFIPFGAYIQYLRVLADPIKRQTYSKDYNAFQNFMNPLLNVVPGTSDIMAAQVGRIGQEKGQIRKYDIPSETMKLFFLNVRSIDKKEYMQYVHEQFREGKVRKRIENKTRGERAIR